MKKLIMIVKTLFKLYVCGGKRKTELERRLEKEYYLKLLETKKQVEQTLQLAEGIDLQMVIFRRLDLIEAELKHIRGLKRVS